jgi:hypothetical protein
MTFFFLIVYAAASLLNRQPQAFGHSFAVDRVRFKEMTNLTLLNLSRDGLHGSHDVTDELCLGFGHK